MGILFTRAYGGVTRQDASTWVNQTETLIRERTEFPVSNLPFWQIDLHPEALPKRVAPDFIAGRKVLKTQILGELKTWILG